MEAEGRMELLSPAGTLEAGLAAFAYGADAVYLGMHEFSARADAGNFGFEELETLLDAAHGDRVRRRKVYVAVNTLVREDELPALMELLGRLEECGVDAVIVQDFAVAESCRAWFPHLALHASTQMALHNAEGVLAARRLGFTRVVAAREVTIPELAKMAKVEGMEIEAFLHGALCYSYSGLCLLSALLHGTSGNRGDCSYVCRSRFSFGEMPDPPGSCCPMSMKDLALGEQIPALRRAGVVSLKIEGRKKTPLYVAAVTNYYRKLLDGSFAPGEERLCEKDVRTIFSRPWTELYARTTANRDVTDPHTTGPRGVPCGAVGRVARRKEGDFLRFTVRHRHLEKHDGLQIEIAGKTRPYGFGVEELRQFPQNGGDRWERVFQAEEGRSVEIPLPPDHPEIPVGSRIFHTSSQEVKRRYSWPAPRAGQGGAGRPVSFVVEIDGDSVRATVADITERLSAPDGFTVAENPAQMEEAVRRAFGRLGGTGFACGGLDVRNPKGLFVPSSLLNQLRRALVEKLAARGKVRLEDGIAAAKTAACRCEPLPPCGERIAVKLPSAEIPDVLLSRAGIDEFVLPLQSAKDVLKWAGEPRVRWSVPVLCREKDRGRIAEAVAAALERGKRLWEIGNLGALEMLRGDLLDIVADWPLYVCNHLAAEALSRRGIHRVTACPEDSAERQLQLAERLGSRYRVILWQKPLAARSATCLMASARGVCPGPRSCKFTECLLENPRGESLRAVNDHCQTNLYLTEPLDLRGSKPLFRKAGVCEYCYDFSCGNVDHAEILSTLEMR